MRGGGPSCRNCPRRWSGPPTDGAGDVAERAARQTDLQRAMARLKPRERMLLWLAYGARRIAPRHRQHAWTENRVDQAAVVPGATSSRGDASLQPEGRAHVKHLECVHEADVLDAVASHRWPDRVDDELRMHVTAATSVPMSRKSPRRSPRITTRPGPKRPLCPARMSCGSVRRRVRGRKRRARPRAPSP